MKNKVIGYEPQDAINAKAHRKEGKLSDEYCALVRVGKETKTPVTLRIYFAGSTAYACVWIHSQWKGKKMVNNSASGSAKAGGWGYCKRSSASAHALINAGVKLEKSINAVGMDAVRDAVEAIARHFYPKGDIYIHHAHG